MNRSRHPFLLSCLTMFLPGALTAVPGGGGAPGDQPAPVAHWPMDRIEDGSTPDAVGNHHGRLQGTLEIDMFIEEADEPTCLAPGVAGRSLKLNDKGYSAHQDRVLIADARPLLAAEAVTFSLWVNPYDPGRGDQAFLWGGRIGDRTSAWELYLAADGRIGLGVYEGTRPREPRKATLLADVRTAPGHWFHAAAVMDGNRVRLFVNGDLAAEGEIPWDTARQGTLEMVMGCAVRREQWGIATDRPFSGALDEVKVFHAALPPAAIRALADHAPEPHPPGLDTTGGYPLWGLPTVPRMADIPELENVRFHVVKPYDFDRDGYRYQHVPALEWHGGRLHAAWTANQDAENTPGQAVLHRFSEDGGATWSEVRVLAAGSAEGANGFNEPVLFSRDGELFAFTGYFTRNPSATSEYGSSKGTRAFRLNGETGEWDYLGDVSGGITFWPLQRPKPLPDGNWIMAGMDFRRNLSRTTYHYPAAVMISRGDDLRQWDVVTLPPPPGPQLGETTLVHHGDRILAIARYHPQIRLVALAASSEDNGRSWTPQQETNLPMPCTKPTSGTLSTGHAYLISTNTADSGDWRSPLTIALARPGEEAFTRLRVIRRSVLPDGPGESHPRARLHYPSAVERDGRLYVIYSVDGVVGRAAGEGRQLWNNNSIELAVIPLESLVGEPW